MIEHGQLLKGLREKIAEVLNKVSIETGRVDPERARRVSYHLTDVLIAELGLREYGAYGFIPKLAFEQYPVERHALKAEYQRQVLAELVKSLDEYTPTFVVTATDVPEKAQVQIAARVIVFSKGY